MSSAVVKRKIARSDASREKRIATLVNEKQKEYGRNATVGSVIRAWSRSNIVPLSKLERSRYIEPFLDAGPAGELEEGLIAQIGTLSLKDVEVAFENLIEASRKRAEGVVYTPDYVIDYIVKRCIEKRSSTKLPRLLDPACGGGGFIMRAAPIVAKAYEVPLERVIAECLHGVDVSPEAVECARVSLDLLCAERKLKVSCGAQNFAVADSLLTPLGGICRALGTPAEGFDLITTNPPYVKLQNLEEGYRASLSERYSEFTQGSYSLAMLFLVAAYRMLTENGMLGFITQNNLFTSVAGTGVREYLQENKCLHSIVDFEHVKVFNNASAYTCLVFLSREPRQAFDYAACANPRRQLPDLMDNSFHQIEINSLRKEKWRLTAPRHLRNIHRLESNGSPLGIIADIRVGFATLKDTVFLLNQGDCNDIEEGITVPAIKIAEVFAESDLPQRRRRIIRPYRKVGARWFAIQPDEIRREFPRAYAYLEQHRAALMGRNKGKSRTSHFYEWGVLNVWRPPVRNCSPRPLARGRRFFWIQLIAFSVMGTRSSRRW